MKLPIFFTNFYFLFLLTSFLNLFAQPHVVEFNQKLDTSALTDLIKSEWTKLFPTPYYDQSIVSAMLINKRPGDITHSTKQLTIKVLHEDQKIVGFITYYFINNIILHIELLAIHSNFRAKGYGKFLINWVINEAKNQGAKAAELYVYNTNPKAIEFYKCLGFTPKYTFPGYKLLSKDIT